MSRANVPAAIRPVLGELESRAAELFADPDARIEPLAAEERQYSFLLRAEVRVGQQAHLGPRIFIKVLNPNATMLGMDALRQRVAREFEVTTQVHAAVAHRDDLFAIRPIACFPDRLAVITEESEGRTLLDCLQRGAAWWSSGRAVDDLERNVAGVGRWLRVFQTLEGPDGPLSLEGLCEYVDVRLHRLASDSSIDFTQGQRRRIQAHLESLAGAVRSHDLRDVVVHGDFAPANILVVGGRVAVLDFAMARRGSHLHDVTRLLVQLDLLCAKPWFRPTVIVELQRRVLRAFDPALEPSHPLVRFLLMLHRVNHLAGLLTRREPFPAAWYNRRVVRQHRQRIAAELQGTAS